MVTKSSPVDLVGIGLNATDTLMSVSEFPAAGSKADVHALSLMLGGQVATAVLACQLWGLRTRYVGKLGDDAAAAAHLHAFESAGVEIQITKVPSCSSAQSHIIVDGDGERTVLWHRDSRLEILRIELDREWVVNAKALLIDGRDTAAATQAAHWARQAGIPVIGDFDQVYPGMEDLLASVDYAVVNRDFPVRISGKRDLHEALRWMQARFDAHLAAATLGAEGVLAWDGKQFNYSAAYRVPVVDTTGAGDLFHAGFVYGLLQSWPTERILDFACAAAALNCTARGARGKIASLDEIEQLAKAGERYSDPPLIPR